MWRRIRARSAVAVLVLLAAGWVAGKWFSSSPREQIGGPRYLIVNADDFGLSDGVSEGILQSWRDGVTTSTSAMMNMPGAPQRLARARAQYPDLPIGLHLNITGGRPVLPPKQAPTLVDANGEFYTNATILEHLPNISLDELSAELHAQAKLFVATAGKFDHIDYHHHMVALYTPFYPVVRELAKEYGVPVRQPVPESVYGHIKLAGGGGAGEAIGQMIHFGLHRPRLAWRLMRYMGPQAFKRQAALLDEENIPTPNWFVDGYYGKPSVENFISMLRQLQPGISEVMAHPANVDSQLSATGGDHTRQRQTELQVLIDPRVKEAVAKYNVRLVNFSFLSRSNAR